MAYDRTYWENAPSKETPLTASALNNIEAGISSAHDGVDALNPAVVNALERIETLESAPPPAPGGGGGLEPWSPEKTYAPGDVVLIRGGLFGATDENQNQYPEAGPGAEILTGNYTIGNPAEHSSLSIPFRVSKSAMISNLVLFYGNSAYTPQGMVFISQDKLSQSNLVASAELNPPENTGHYIVPMQAQLQEGVQYWLHLDECAWGVMLHDPGEMWDDGVYFTPGVNAEAVNFWSGTTEAVLDTTPQIIFRLAGANPGWLPLGYFSPSPLASREGEVFRDPVTGVITGGIVDGRPVQIINDLDGRPSQIVYADGNAPYVTRDAQGRVNGWGGMVIT